MPRTESPVPDLHLNSGPFLGALSFTAAETGFLPRLIEKDYFCSLALGHLARRAPAWVFKGGTCLAKVHAGFYRLSEDLDFAISTPISKTRKERSLLAAEGKRAIEKITQNIPALRVLRPLQGAAVSTQYLAELEYVSLLDGHREPIKIEVSLREAFLEACPEASARTLLLDPLNGTEMVARFSVPCISWPEAMAEKVRAAMTRLEPAIRDYYDLDHAVRKQGLVLSAPGFQAMVRQKLAVPGNASVALGTSHRDLLHKQVRPILSPVLREADFEVFDLDLIYEALTRLAQGL